MDEKFSLNNLEMMRSSVPKILIKNKNRYNFTMVTSCKKKISFLVKISQV